MPETRRTFFKQLGMLGALALVSPTGAIEAIVPKEPKSPLSKGEFGIIERFTMYCHSRPPGHVGHSVCAVETLIDPKSFGTVVRGLSVGKYYGEKKYFSYVCDTKYLAHEAHFEAFAELALKQIKQAWLRGRHKSLFNKPWGIAPPTMTYKAAQIRLAA